MGRYKYTIELVAETSNPLTAPTSAEMGEVISEAIDEFAPGLKPVMLTVRKEAIEQ